MESFVQDIRYGIRQLLQAWYWWAPWQESGCSLQSGGSWRNGHTLAGATPWSLPWWHRC
jgi:hypothetical protein